MVEIARDLPNERLLRRDNLTDEMKWVLVPEKLARNAKLILDQMKSRQVHEMGEYVEGRDVQPQDGEPVFREFIETRVACIRQKGIGSLNAELVLIRRL